EKEAVPRVSELGAIVASTTGKIELEAVGEASDEKVLTRLVQRAVLNVFKRTFAEPELADVVKACEGGLTVHASDVMPSADYVKQVAELRGLRTSATKLGATERAATAAAIEVVLEGLQLTNKLNNDGPAGCARYRR